MPKANIIREVVSVLTAKGLTMYRVSKKTRELYGRSSPYYVPHNYYSQLEEETFTPSIYQLIALSRISGYRLPDWLNLFGIDLSEIINLQVRLPSARTQVLNAAIDREHLIPVLQERFPRCRWDQMAPLSRLLGIYGVRRHGTGVASSGRSFVYAKIGYEDALAFPCLAAGSIVRTHSDTAAILYGQELGTTSNGIFLLEHGNGHICCRLRRIGASRFSTVSCRLPFPEIELTLRKQARILGVVDLEVRSLVRTFPARLPMNLGRSWISDIGHTPTTVARLLQAARRRMNLSLPAVSRLSHEVAEYFADRRYSISASSLSDYEVAADAPRHIHKVISLCAIYGLQFCAFLRALGVDPETCGAEPMPSSWPDESKNEQSDSRFALKNEPDDRLAALKSELAELPILLSDSLAHIACMRKLSLEDFFWTGEPSNPLHPLLRGSILAIVNRRKKNPGVAAAMPCYEQPLSVLLRRDGSYIAGFTTLERDLLTVHGVPQHQHRTIQLRNRDEAEVVGKIVALLRRIA